MFSITEQFSAVTKSQLEAQLNLLNNYASKAVESAQKVLALNISTTKASMEQTSAAARRLLEAKDPQEFFSVGSQPPSLDKLLAYSRELFSIASAAQAELMQSAKDQIKVAAPAAQAAVAEAKSAAKQAAAPALADVKKAAVAPVAAANQAIATPTIAPTVAPTVAPPVAAKPVAAKAKPAAVTPVADAIVQLVEPAEQAKPAAAPVAAPAPKAVVVKPVAKPAAAPKAAAKPTAVSFPTAKSVALKSVTPTAKTAPGKPQQAKQLDMLGGGKAKK